MMIAKVILILYVVIGAGVALQYVYLCIRYSTSQDLRDYTMLKHGEEEGSRLIGTYTQPRKIIWRILLSLVLWPTVLTGFLHKIQSGT